MVLLDVRLTTDPPVGAGPLSVTVPVEVPPPTTEMGFSDRPESPEAPIVNFAAFDTVVPCDAVIVAVVVD